MYKKTVICLFFVMTLAFSLSKAMPASCATGGDNNDLRITKLYPQPAGKQLNIEIVNIPENCELNIVIANILGCQVAEKSIKPGINTFMFNTADFHEGIYIISVTADNKAVLTKKFTVSH